MEPIKNNNNKEPIAPKGIDAFNGVVRRVKKTALSNIGWFVGIFLIAVVIVVFTTDISFTSGLGWERLGLTLFVLFFCSYSMFVNFFSSGTIAGRATDIFTGSSKKYDELKKTVVDKKLQGRLTEFCEHYIESELKHTRSTLLEDVGLDYDEYLTKYIGKDGATLKKDESLSKAQRKAIIKANKTKPIKLIPEMLLRRGRGGSSRRPLGMKPETKKDMAFGFRFVKTMISSILTGVIMLDVIIDPTWATFAACCLKLLPVVLNGFLGYKRGYENITVDTVGYMDDQSDLLQQAIHYLEVTPVPEKALTAEERLVEIPIENEAKMPMQ